MSRKKLAWANKEVETFVCILGEEDVVYDVYVAAAAIDIRLTTKVRYFPYTALLSIRLDTPPPLSLLSASPPHHGLSFEVPFLTSLPSLRPSFVSLFRPLPRGYTGTMEATTLVLLVLLDCLLVSSSRPFRSSSGGPPMVCNFIKSDVEES
ncbi:unnamed protein product [Boreogadus saida]